MLRIDIPPAVLRIERVIGLAPELDGPVGVALSSDRCSVVVVDGAFAEVGGVAVAADDLMEMEKGTDGLPDEGPAALGGDIALLMVKPVARPAPDDPAAMAGA